ncbi:transaldolase [Rubellimicrobium thermophilum DSM 16684]|uniref:Transaldolase n=1 Tax=Rubellimicrobium thermophilum DSM 16684 TaxID=1123069 RepID=S9QS34_9RHOB|nr:transaldolase [Rubellimicrobium thermophilum]EPX84191.1 transaldolase [Rubellimicrobium thermophilum DSM 16684]
MTSKLDQLRAMTVVVADTGDLDAVRRLKPQDCTTNPSLVLKALSNPAMEDRIARAVAEGRQAEDPVAAIALALTVGLGVELAGIVPGRVSTEVDARLSFDTEGSIRRARAIIEAYGRQGVGPDRVLIKLASTWEGIRAAERLEREGINCNLTLLFSMAQARACADAGVFLISPFVGRITDWWSKKEGRTYTPDEDPGVQSVRRIYDHYKRHGITTVVMGASFRNTGQIEALAGCDRLTISPELMEKLAAEEGELPRRLSPGAAEGRAEPLPEAEFRWQLNEDAMATEKLAEGIRNFHADALKLEQLIRARLVA